MRAKEGVHGQNERVHIKRVHSSSSTAIAASITFATDQFFHPRAAIFILGCTARRLEGKTYNYLFGQDEYNYCAMGVIGMLGQTQWRKHRSKSTVYGTKKFAHVAHVSRALHQALSFRLV
jgi:hypothetical protein